MNLPEKVKAAIERENLIPEGAYVVVGVSGGADSVALLHILYRLGYSLIAAHLNHCIRGAEADADEQFVKELCAKLGIKCVTAKADVPALAKQKGISLEMAAREARHAFFKSVVCPPSSVVCLAHHADDQLETFFLRVARGTGPSGLGGMRYSQKLAAMQLLRPMLGIRRAEIIQWLEKEGIEWREDASNTDESISRNFVRRQLLPMFGKLNDRAAENILRTMEILRDEDDLPERASRRREIRDWLIEQGVSPDFETVETAIEFASRKDGTRFLDVEGLRIVNEYGMLRAECGSGILPLARGWTRSEAFGTKATTGGSGNPLPQKMTIKIEEGTGILRGPWCASVSLAKVAGREVIVRVAKPGDRMEPYGMEGSKKLQDIFTDLKIPKAQRENWPVVECGGEIIWLPGYRIARGWELSSDSEPALHLVVNKDWA